MGTARKCTNRIREMGSGLSTRRTYNVTTLNKKQQQRNQFHEGVGSHQAKEPLQIPMKEVNLFSNSAPSKLTR